MVLLRLFIDQFLKALLIQTTACAGPTQTILASPASGTNLFLYADVPEIKPVDGALVEPFA